MNLNASAIERLTLKVGEEPSALHLGTLDRTIAAQQALPGKGVRRKIFPWGTHESFTSGGGSGFVSPYFAPQVGGGLETGFEVKWARGLIEGVEPTIDGVPISGDKKTGVIPSFRITRDQFSADGECLVYFRLALAHKDFTAEKIEPFAAPKVPLLVPWQADCLALILFADGTHWRKLVANQGHVAINRRPDGRATHIFWAKF